MKKIMELPVTYSLVQGNFKAEDAKDILVSMISSKIFYHGAKIMKSFEQDGADGDHSRNRIKELKKARNQIIRLLQDAADSGQTVRVTSDINIEIVE